ncbi:facilitated trehalose transporter Tret1-like [Belonocnema kinseyi]|uniref:facilitated trehalose transporter Tret1-like n=1 Tax=Belonocnema kinseyi TaxID=2817044 RepID=UPI00143DDA52|nr:facilitated trehalose transporter Tret1-like [Belonocnema kinseyi]
MVSKERKQILLQYAAGITASIGAAGYGANISWTSPAVSYLTSPISHIPTSKEQSDWVASLYPVGLVIGYLLNPLIIDTFGRKRTLLLLTIPQIISWVMIILANDCLIIYIARILGGIGYGAKICSLTVYLSEIGSKKNRGIFLVFLPVFINTGMLYVMILGAYLSYNLMNIALFILPIIFFATFFFMPESSDFREKTEDIKMKSLLNLPELEDVNKNGKINHNEGFYTSTLKFKESRLWKLVALRNNRKALMTVIFLSAYIAFSGDTTLTYFTEQILSFSGFFISAKKATIILTCTKVVASLISIPLVERVGPTCWNNTL